MKTWVDKVNGYGVLFRFILPLFVGLTAFFGKIAYDNVLNRFDRLDVAFSNHLSEHRQIAQEYFDSSKRIEGRLACIETEIKVKRK